MAALSIISRTLPSVQVEQAYSEQLQVVGGAGPYAWSLVAGFGTLPVGTALSSGGILSALAGAISPDQVGSYGFRLKVVDAVLAEQVFDYILIIIPFGFNRVPSYLIDNKLENVSAQQLIELLSRRKNERHFRHGALGSEGTPWTHLDEDIKVPDWLTALNDLGLREVLDSIYGDARFSMKSINLVLPDWTDRDFDMIGGSGITVSPITNGLQLDADLSGLVPVTPVGQTDTVIPGSTSVLALTSDTFVAQLLVKADDDEWYQRSAIPSNAGKRLFANIPTESNGIFGMAVGDDGLGNKVVHVCWLDSGGILQLDRFDGETLASLESFPIGVSTITHPPLVMTGNSGEVLVAFTDAANAFYYGVLNPVDYTDTTSPAYLAVTSVAVGGAAGPNPTTDRIAGTVPPALSAAVGLCYIGFDIAGVPNVAEFDTVTPGSSGGFIQTKPVPAGGGAILDLVADSVSDIIDVAVLDGISGPADNIELVQDDIPFVPGVMSTTAGVLAIGTGTNIVNGSLVIADSMNSPGERACLLAFVEEVTWPLSSTISYVSFDNVQLMPATGPFPTGNTDHLGLGQDSALLKNWSGDQCEVVALFPTCVVNEGEIQRLVLGVNDALREQGIIRRAMPSPQWLRGAHTSEGSANAQDLRFYDEQNVFGAAETIFSAESLHLVHDPTTHQLTAVNDSPFTWDIRITAMERDGYSAPPNLLIACWQLAQALQNYWNANGFYPSPSTSGVNGVTWDEVETGGTPTLTIIFNDYYTVTPGEWDLNQGLTAAAWYHGTVVAGSASDQTLAFKYTSYPAEIAVAEAAIKVDVDAYIAATPPLPQPSGNYYTLGELDVVLGTTHAVTYAGAPYSLYRYFLFLDPTGLIYEHGFFSKNYVENSNAYGPAPIGVGTVPVVEHFGPLTGDDVPGVPHNFTLGQGVLSARVMVNGVEYYQGIHWIFNGNNVIRYLNDLSDYVLQTGDRISIWKYTAV